MVFESQYKIANISATKSPILMKFQTKVHKIGKNYQIFFCKDPCTHGRTPSLNVHARVSSRQNARAHVYALFARVCAWIFTKKNLVVLYYLMNLSFKFHKDRRFRCRDIRKTVLAFKSHQFSIYFPYFHSYTPQKSSKMDNY